MIDNEKPRSIWTVLYDFLDDLISATIPGAFFVLFCAAVVLTSNIYQDMNLTTLSGSGWFVVLVVFSYCFGIIFFRLEIGKIDEISSRYIFHKGIGSDNNSFAFACALTEEKIAQWRACLHEIIKHGDTAAAKDAANSAAPPSLTRVLPDAEYTVKLYPYQNFATRLSGRGRSLYYCLFHRNRYQLLKKRNQLYNTVSNALLVWLSSAANAQSNQMQSRKRRKPCTLIARRIATGESGTANQFEIVCLTDRAKASPVTHAQEQTAQQGEKSADSVNEKTEQGKGEAQNESSNEPDCISDVALSALLDMTNQVSLYAEFPYTYMAQYLTDRGLLNQVKYVSWGYSPLRNTADAAQMEQASLAGDRNRRVAFRSKNALNRLKTEVKQSSAYARFQIDKTEAHVRFMNAIWHSARLTRCCSFTLTILITCLLCLQIIDISSRSILTQTALKVMPRIVTLPYFNMLIANVGFLLLSTYICFQIRSIIHYQRVREVVSLLLLKEDGAAAAKQEASNVVEAAAQKEQGDSEQGDAEAAAP